MIDKDKVKAFWDARARKYGTLDVNSIANLEEDPENLALKVRLESEKVFEYVGSLVGKTVLDLGAGVGQWAFRFLEHGASHVTAVEYSADQAEVCKREAQNRKVSNIEVIVSPAETYTSNGSFDIVFISGMFVCMADDQAEQLVSNLSRICGPHTLMVVRDGTALGKRYEINNRFSDHLKMDYSATYRTADEYEALFKRHGFKVARHENMFYDGCALNKYPETRLRIYEVRLAAKSGASA